MIPVTIVTRDAAASDMSDQEYRDLYDEIRGKTVLPNGTVTYRMTLRELQDAIGSERSFAWWSKYERFEARLSRQDKRDLRTYVHMPELPLSIEEAIAGVHPDAIIWRVGGAELADRVCIIAEPDPITIRLNGGIEIIENPGADPVQNCDVMPCNARYSGATGRVRDVSSIVIKKPVWQRLNDLRNQRGITWEQLLSNLLEGE